jgi:hypothetical protein
MGINISPKKTRYASHIWHTKTGAHTAYDVLQKWVGDHELMSDKYYTTDYIKDLLYKKIGHMATNAAEDGPMTTTVHTQRWW